MKLEKFGKIIILLLMVGVFILATSTLFTNPLALFLTIVVGSGLIIVGVLGVVFFMIKDIKSYLKIVDKEAP